MSSLRSSQMVLAFIALIAMMLVLPACTATSVSTTISNLAPTETKVWPVVITELSPQTFSNSYRLETSNWPIDPDVQGNDFDLDYDFTNLFITPLKNQVVTFTVSSRFHPEDGSVITLGTIMTREIVNQTRAVATAVPISFPTHPDKLPVSSRMITFIVPTNQIFDDATFDVKLTPKSTPKQTFVLEKPYVIQTLNKNVFASDLKMNLWEVERDEAIPLQEEKHHRYFNLTFTNNEDIPKQPHFYITANATLQWRGFDDEKDASCKLIVDGDVSIPLQRGSTISDYFAPVTLPVTIPKGSTTVFTCENSKIRIGDEEFDSGKAIVFELRVGGPSFGEGPYSSSTITVDSFAPKKIGWMTAIIVISVVMGIVLCIWVISMIVLKKQKSAQNNNISVQDGFDYDTFA